MVEKAIVLATPKQQVGKLLAQANEILLLKNRFKRDVHYGPPYPGSKKDTLLKPGAELLARRFGLRPHYVLEKEILTINPAELTESCIVYIYRCEMIDIETGLVVGEAIGACSSLEDKYHYRNDRLKCPDCGKETLMISKNNPNAYWCNKYKDGCGREFALNDERITSQQVGKSVNPNPLNELNTVIKIAQKRAFVSSVIVATGASAYFTPGDVEIKDAFEVATPADDDSDVMEATWEDVGDGGQSFPTDITRVGGTSSASGWATADTLKSLFASLAKESSGNIQPSDIPGLIASITDVKNCDQWNATFESGKAAGLAIVAALNEQLKNSAPATPKSASGNKKHEWTADEIKAMDEACTAWWDEAHAISLTATLALAVLGADSIHGMWSSYDTPELAMNALKAYAMSNRMPIICRRAQYSGSGKNAYTLLSNGQVGVRLYGRDPLRVLSPAWASFVDAWKEGDKYDLPAPLLIRWEDKGKYLLVTKDEDAVRLMPKLSQAASVPEPEEDIPF